MECDSLNQGWKDQNSLSTLEDVLKRGGIVGLLGDQRPETSSTKVLYSHPSPDSLKIVFFGHRISSFSGFAILHQRTLSPVWFAALVEVSNGPKRFRLIMKNLTPTSRPDVTALVQRYYDLLQGLITLYPQQYYWLHNRFKEIDV